MTQYTDRAGFPYFQRGDRNWDNTVARLVRALDAAQALGAFAVRPSLLDADGDPLGLTVAVSPGTFLNSTGQPVEFTGSSVTVTSGATTYIWVGETGAISTGAVWPVASHLRVAIVTADADNVTAIVDARNPYRSLGSPPLTSADQAAVALTNVGATNSGDVSGVINANFAAVQTLLNQLRSDLVTLKLIKGSA